MMAMRRGLPTIAALGLVALLAGCGAQGTTTAPTACLDPVGQYLNALKAAPDAVRLGGQTPISDCFSGIEDPDIGQTVIKAATILNAQARRDPGGDATVSLGYLDGAVRVGTERATGEADLARRVDTAARYNPHGGSLGAPFERSFGKGYAAGEATG
jgi:hypothetical protein